jgi:hypothetical protein
VAAYAGLKANPQLGAGVFQPTPFQGFAWLDGWTRWDGEWYWQIARDGYSYTPGAQSSVAFFPGYPLLAKLLSLPLRLFLSEAVAFHLAGIVLSWGCFLIALVGLERLCSRLLGEDAARRAVWLLALYPFSYFFGATYTESLFLALAVWAFAFGLEGRFWPACLLAGAATGVRSTGAFVGAALALEYLRTRDFDVRKLDRSAFAFVLTPFGVGLYVLYLALRFREPLAFLKVEGAAGWGHELRFPDLSPIVEALMGTIHPYPVWRPMMAWYALLIVATPFLLRWSWQKLGAPLTLYCALSFCAFFFSGNLISTGRYLSTVFPFFMVLGLKLRGRVGFGMASAGFAACLCLFAVSFVHGFAPI